MSIKIDDGDSVEIDIYDSSKDDQTLDSIVKIINEYCVEYKLNMFAYKVRALKCYELAVSHILPNFAEDSKNRTLTITTAASGGDASTALGFSYILDRE